MFSTSDILTVVVVAVCIVWRQWRQSVHAAAAAAEVPTPKAAPLPVPTRGPFDLETTLVKWYWRARHAGFSDAVCSHACNTVMVEDNDGDTTPVRGRMKFCDVLRSWTRIVSSRPALFHTFMSVPEAAVAFVESSATDGAGLGDLPPELQPFASSARPDVPVLPFASAAPTNGVMVTHTEGAVSFFVRANPLSAFLSSVDFGAPADASMDREVAAFIVARILNPLAEDVKTCGAGLSPTPMYVHTYVTAFPTPELHIEVVADREADAVVAPKIGTKRNEREKLHINMTAEDAISVFTTIKDRLCTYAPLFTVGMYVLQDNPPWTFRLVLPPAYFEPELFRGERRKTWMLHNMDASMMSPTLLEEAVRSVDEIRKRAPPHTRSKTTE